MTESTEAAQPDLEAKGNAVNTAISEAATAQNINNSEMLMILTHLTRNLILTIGNPAVGRNVGEEMLKAAFAIEQQLMEDAAAVPVAGNA